VSSKEEVLKGLSEEETHSTVNGEVYWVAKHNEEVGEEDGQIEGLIVYDGDIEDILSDMKDGTHGQRGLRRKK